MLSTLSMKPNHVYSRLNPLKMSIGFSLAAFFVLLPLSSFAGDGPSQAAKAQAASLPELKKLGIAHTITKKTSARLQKLSAVEDQYYIDVQLGKLTQANFSSLKALFNNRSAVPFTAERSYNLIDFLDPAIQATVNKVFLPKSYYFEQLEATQASDEEIVFALNKSGVESSINCWGTTMQLLRQRSQKRSSDQYYFYWPDRWGSDEALKDDKTSQLVKAQDVKPGDVLLVSAKNMMSEQGEIQHTAVILTKDLVYEKTDSSENDPYRIALLSDVLKKYKKVLEDELVIEYRRYKLNGATEAFAPPKLPAVILSKEIKAKILSIHPDLKVDQLVPGCETGIGGGCSPTHSEIELASLKTDPKTGRGVLSGPPALLKRLVPVTE